MTMVKFGVMGAGRIAHRFCQAMNGIDESIRAIASRDPERAERFAMDFGIEKAYGTYEELLADPEVACVYIATPHALHHAQIMACLEAGKNVLCEKAFTLNHRQAKEVFDFAVKKGLFVMEAMWTRFLPAINEVKRLIDAGEIGDIIEIDADFSFASGAGPDDRLFDPALGGGALLDVGIYPVTLVNLFLGIPDSFDTEVTMGSSGVDVSEKITYFYPHASAILYASIVADGDREAYIYGTKGYVHLPNFWSTEVATVYNNNHKIVREISCKHMVNGMEYEIFEALRCIRAKSVESAVCPHEATLEILRQMDAIRASWNFRYPGE
jgi:predicted dehydrogenase